MSFLDRFKKAKSARPASLSVTASATEVLAPVSGEGVAMASLPDSLFAGGAMGTAYGVEPTEGIIYAPVSGTVTATTATLHAMGLCSDAGVEVLIHVGVDTVNMKGDGFAGFVEKGQRVAAGEPLMSFDRAKIRQAGYPDTVIVVITNTDDLARVEPVAPAHVSAGEKIFEVASAR